MSLYGDMLGAAEDGVWKALADPTRREMVAWLTTRPRTTGALVERFSPQLVRTAVMKHLDVLAEAGLLRVEREGRTRWNHLNEKPLHQVGTWLKRRVLTHQSNLERLKKLTESKSNKLKQPQS